MPNEILIEDALSYLLQTDNEQLAIDLASIDIPQYDLNAFIDIIKFINQINQNN